MADDIDIEEHDVLESLRRRQPEVVVKTEPPDYTEPQYGEPASGYDENQWNWPQTTEAPKIKEEPAEDIPFGKIILGTKPSLDPAVATPPEKPQQDAEEITSKNYNYNMSLVLDDWGPTLETSNCYCPECQILFATVNALDAHKMAAHSFLVATEKEPSPERNKAVKSTAKINDNDATCQICKKEFIGANRRSNLLRHYREVHKVDPFTDDLSNWKICNHCNVYFPSDTALVKHLYELLPLSDKKTPAKDEKKAPVRAQSAVKSTTALNVKAKSHTVVNTERIAKTVQTVNEKKAPVRQTAVKSTTALNVKAKTPAVINTARIVKPVRPVASCSNNVNSSKVKNATVVKDVKNVNSVAKKVNSLILGTKVSVKSENGEEQNNFSTRLRKCEVCGIEYSRKYYYKHMGRFHPDFLVTKMRRLKKPSNSLHSTIRYKCTLCHQIIVGRPAVKRHRQTHPQMGRRKILKLIKTNKVIAKPKPTVKKEQTEENINLVVSKSTLFKCNQCSVHFLTCYGACAHSRVCENSSNGRKDFKCPQCQRVFKNTDRKAHELQHKSYSAKFKVYVVYSEMVIRILCECPTCHVCFEEYKFWRHVNFGCEKDAESFYCNECRLPIDATSRNSHESKHTQGDFTKEDFIKVDFVSSKTALGTIKIKSEIATPKKVLPLKRKAEAEEEIPIKKRKTREEFHLFYCPTCKCYSHVKTKFHMEKKCKNVVSKNGFTKKKLSRQSCNICALSFSYKTYEPHKKLHEKYPDLTLSNLVFTRITDDKKIRPVPENFPCRRCQVTFATKESKSTHACGGTKTAECQVCQKKIERQSFAAHMRFHNYVMPSKAQLTTQRAAAVEVMSPNEIKPNLKRNEVAPMTQKLPELLMKYKSLTTQWNILYLCDTCDTFTDSYDKVVEHCQNHFTNMESYGVVIMKCQICNMKFDRECYRRHLELHAGSNVISRKSFKILTYDHSKIFTEDWLSFMDLPEDKKTQILNRSIYGETRSVRLKLVQQGPPEFTVYRCVQCLKCVPSDSLDHHINLQNCLKANKITCSVCEMVFVNRATCDQHEWLHQTNNLQADSFRIIAFNDSNTEFNNKPYMAASEESKRDVVMEESPENSDSLKFHSDNVKTIKGKKFYMFYKCGGCDVCMLSDSGSKKHICSDRKKMTCNKCGLKFSIKYLSVHARFHAKYDFSHKNVFTKTFNNKVNDNKVVINKINSSSAIESEKTQNENKDGAKLYKCHCGLHYTSLKSIEKHYQAKNCGSVVREKCSQCNLIFDPLEIVNHLCKHHAQAQFKTFDVITPTKKTLYKCNQCHVLFYDKNIAIIHKGKCEGMASGTKCEQCGLAFHRTSIEKHRDDHKTGGTLKTDCYIVANIPNDQTASAVLFKCKDCDVCFLLRPTLFNHIKYNNHRMIKIMQCKECGLRFSHTSLPRHVDLHHVKQKVVDFEFRFTEIGLKSKPKVEGKTIETSQEEESEEEEIESVQEDNVTQLKPIKECQIYKCKKCALHFLDENTLISHNDTRCSKETSEECDICDIKFAARNMKEHKKQHVHNELSISVVDNSERPESETTMEETDEDQITSAPKLYKCHKCELHYNNKKTLKIHLVSHCSPNPLSFKCDECGFSFTKVSLARHKVGHPKKSFEIVTLTELEIKRLSIPPTVAEETQSQASKSEVVSLDSSFELESTDSQEKAQIKLYKCGDCNVYFLTQRVCYKHVIKHTAMDSKEYIECKLCGFQFTIMALQSHIKKHHSVDFNLEEVLVEEYQPNDLTNNVPKIEIYYAIDKYQSRLVSTTSDVKNDSKAGEIGDGEAKKAENEVTSNCDELIEKIDANQNDSQVVENEMDVVVNDSKDVEIGTVGDGEAKKAEDEVTSNCNELIEKIDANQNDSQIVENKMDVVVNDLKDVEAGV